MPFGFISAFRVGWLELEDVTVSVLTAGNVAALAGRNEKRTRKPIDSINSFLDDALPTSHPLSHRFANNTYLMTSNSKLKF